MGSCHVCSMGCALSLWSCNTGSEDIRKHEGRKNNLNGEALGFTGDTDSAALTLPLRELRSPNSKRRAAFPHVAGVGQDKPTKDRWGSCTTEPRTTPTRKVLLPRACAVPRPHVPPGDPVAAKPEGGYGARAPAAQQVLRAVAQPEQTLLPRGS